eukprot:Clim_evm32s238 gene=Clim_evmTU32s238
MKFLQAARSTAFRSAARGMRTGSAATRSSGLVVRYTVSTPSVSSGVKSAPVQIRAFSTTLAQQQKGSVAKRIERQDAKLTLSDGTTFVGKSFGADKPISGEVVFSTAIVGYPESMTDPSYKGQILVLTQPMVGNYGVPNREFDKYGLLKVFESDKIQIAGLVVNEYSEVDSHWTSGQSLEAWLRKEGIPAITGVDTRALAHKVREGTLLGGIAPEGHETPSLVDPNKKHLMDIVSVSEPVVYNKGAPYKVVAVDCGMKNNIIRALCDKNMEVTVVPWNYNYHQLEYDGLFISNGPGDPAMAQELIENVRKNLNAPAGQEKPVFGICMGNHILGRAAGLDTHKMPYGNRGHNQPAWNQISGECIITSQNHGFAIDDRSLTKDSEWQTYFRNANDGSNEGLIHKNKPFASVQFHPEATGGPTDSMYLFKVFADQVKAGKNQRIVDVLTQQREYLFKRSNFANRVKDPVSRVLVLGSGGLSIGQAGEFDYSGSQAIKALKEENVESILVNSNIATVQTDSLMADTVYFLPVTTEYLEKIIEREQPDGILCTFGGQTALNAGVQLEHAGILAKHDVKVLGTPIATLELSEDRDLFAEALKSIKEPVAVSQAVDTVEEALSVADKISYPVIVRSAYSLGGLGSGFANNSEELRELAGKSLSLAPQILVERSMKGWKEVEYEVVRDRYDNCITVCNMENFDPLGIHTGDSIVVAPSQTLTDYEYHKLREAAIKIIRHLGVVGECNVQYALNPETSEYCVIEVNARLSRSSALASKATGYPLAHVAAKLALGHQLPELRNAVTRETTACFEPSLDYVVAKVPRWDLRKFNHVSPKLGSAMKSVGESMAIGRSFEEVIQKALRMQDSANTGIMWDKAPSEEVNEVLVNADDRRIHAIGYAMKHLGYSVDQLHDLTKVDKWFLSRIQNMLEIQTSITNAGGVERVNHALMLEAKRAGFSDKQIGQAVGTTELTVRSFRKDMGIEPVVKQIDTLAGEFPAQTNYLYMTYHGTENDVAFGQGDNAVLVLGSGTYRIGSSVEFDWSGVSAIRALRKAGKQAIMLNYNPETVSTDYDECDRLYFEEISLERSLDVLDKEAPMGVIVSVGGQLAQNLAVPLEDNGAPILGTSPSNIDRAENRFEFSKFLDSIKVDQPEWKELSKLEDVFAFTDRVSYPVLVRPSYVLSGAAMKVAWSNEELEKYLGDAVDVSPEHPVVVTKFITGADEIDVDAVAANGKLVIHAVAEHIENAGVHSGDASLVLPSRDLDQSTLGRIKEIAEKVAAGLEITGPFNMQIIHKDGELKVIECNLRASRSLPFCSKVMGYNFIELATRAMLGEEMSFIDTKPEERNYQAVKAPQFSFTRLGGADPMLSVEMASTGEVACFGADKYEAYLKALRSVQNFKIPKKNVLMCMDGHTNPDDVVYTAEKARNAGLNIYGDESVCELLGQKGIPATMLGFSLGKNAVQQAFLKKDIEMVLNLSLSRPLDRSDVNYLLRRMAVDYGVPLINHPRNARMFMDSLNRMPAQTGAEGDRVLSWSEYVDMRELPTQRVHSGGQ